MKQGVNMDLMRGRVDRLREEREFEMHARYLGKYEQTESASGVCCSFLSGSPRGEGWSGITVQLGAAPQSCAPAIWCLFNTIESKQPADFLHVLWPREAEISMAASLHACMSLSISMYKCWCLGGWRKRMLRKALVSELFSHGIPLQMLLAC